MDSVPVVEVIVALPTVEPDATAARIASKVIALLVNPEIANDVFG